MKSRVIAQLSQYFTSCGMTVIIGYNEKTNEIAVSDSWGLEYELRWVHLDIAKAMTDSLEYVIDF